MRQVFAIAGFAVVASVWGACAQQPAGEGNEVAPLTGAAAFGDWTADRPGQWRKITVDDLPAPYATRAVSNGPSLARAAEGALPRVPAGFAVAPFVTGLAGPRMLRGAPNGDIFVVESLAGNIRVVRAADGAAKPDKVDVFARDLDEPFGIAFYPPGPDPNWLYVAETNAIRRFPYVNGDLVARGASERVIELPISQGGAHWTRDILFSPDGERMYVSIGSASNVADAMKPGPDKDSKRFVADHPLGAA
jgi:glucose/arabinose dehydrogenase